MDFACNTLFSCYHLYMLFVTPKLPAKDFKFDTPVGGADFLSVDPHDIRLHACGKKSNHPVDRDLPVIFYEVLARRFAVTEDIDAISLKLPLPLPIRHEVKDLTVFLNSVIQSFPMILKRAAWHADQTSLIEKFDVKIEQAELSVIYSEAIKESHPRDKAALLSSYLDFAGWNKSSDASAINSLADIMKTLPKMKSRDDGHRLLPSDHKKLEE